jgi:hypothetical protein
MKRSVLMSALVLAMASSLAVTACGGGGGSGEPAKDGDSAKKDGEEGSDDPVVEAQKISEGIQKDVDAILQPIKDFDAILDSLTKLPDDLKKAKSKADGKKVLAAMKVLLDGKEVDVTLLKLDEAGGGIVKERIDKVKALIDSTKDIDDKVKALVQRVTDAAPKIAAAAAKALPKLEAKIKAPLGVSADDKKKAEEDKKKIQEIADGFKKKVEEWQKLLTELPPKVKEFPQKLAKAFAGGK